MAERRSRAEFEAAFLPHLAQAHGLARWLVRDPSDAEDLVQEAYLRAFRGYAAFRGGDGLAWLLAIVRNACMSHLRRAARTRGKVVPLRPAWPDRDADEAVEPADPAAPVEDMLERDAERARVRDALWRLPEPLREVIVLREFEDLPYARIAEVTGLPVGTVMSRLSRARARLRELLAAERSQGDAHEL